MGIVAYGGVNNVAITLLKGFCGVAGAARPLKKAYAGVNGVASLFWEGVPDVGFKFPFSNESLTGDKIEFVEEVEI